MAVVLCAITLSLAYPVREYLAQRRQLDQLAAQHQVILAQLGQLQREQRHLGSASYIERLAAQRLHMCLAGDTCYVVVGASTGHKRAQPGSGLPWYDRLWQSVRTAGAEPRVTAAHAPAHGAR